MNSRITAVRQILSEENLDAIIISSVSHIIWLTGYTGFSKDERECYLLITKKSAYLFTDLRYTEAIRVLVPQFETKETNESSSFATQLDEIEKSESLNTIGCETNNLTVDEFLRLKKTKLNLASIDLSELRIGKDDKEIEAIRNACAIGDKTFEYICQHIKTGMTERDVAKLMASYIREQNAELSFPTIVAFGENAAVPHHLTSDRKLKPGDCILMDFGVKYEKYCSDMTRTVFFGDPTDEQNKVYETVKAAQQKAIEYIEKQLRLYSSSEQSESRSSSRLRSNNIISASAADKAARNFILKQGYPTIPHSLGHGIGVEVHEAPSLSPRSGYTLEEGMVFSIEPGIYLNGDMGVRIEDLFVIINGELKQLTRATKHFTVIKK